MDERTKMTDDNWEEREDNGEDLSSTSDNWSFDAEAEEQEIMHHFKQSIEILVPLLSNIVGSVIVTQGIAKHL